MLPIYGKSTEERKKHKQANNEEKIYLLFPMVPDDQVVENYYQKGQIYEQRCQLPGSMKTLRDTETTPKQIITIC